MNTAAIVTTFTILGSLAYAAGHESAIRPQPAGVIERSRFHEGGADRRRLEGTTIRHQGTAMAALAGGDGSCTIGEPLNWFTQVHPLPECADLVWGGFYTAASSLVSSRSLSVDIDGDGRDDHVVLAGDYTDTRSGSTYLVRSYALQYGASASGDYLPSVGSNALFRVTAASSFGDTALTLSPIMSGSVLLDALCAVTKPCDGTVAAVYFTPTDFKDMDDDGDLDLILSLEVANSDWTLTYYRVWIENTVKANPALAADINRDGVVDGKDLATVLASWTP
jgi:hypothetical protein